MKKYILKLLTTLFILLLIVFSVGYFLNFRFSDVAFVLGTITCFLFYNVGSSSLSDAKVSMNTGGTYVEKKREDSKSFINPLFLAACITLLSSFAL